MDYPTSLRKRVITLEVQLELAYQECLKNPTLENIEKRNALTTDLAIAKSRRDNYGKPRAVMTEVTINNII